jgi:hypothetical protein
LIVATFATLYFVPCVFSLIHKNKRIEEGVTDAELGIN